MPVRENEQKARRFFDSITCQCGKMYKKHVKVEAVLRASERK
ncbi:MAG: hypothetical protein EGR90_06365 [Lachnospiraceae bacterium]|nr:hypothetical protein [Lachnospiraceae bacterium]